jgi:feruloyl esterase
VYFSGGSTGGREALTAAIRWPETYDGILSNYPAARFLGTRLWGAALTRAIYSDDSAGWIAPRLVEQISTRAIDSCDGLDAAKDGLVSNIVACRAQSATLVEEFSCPDGVTSVDCLTPVQIERTIAIYHDGYELPYELANGFKRYEGYNSLEGVLMSIGRTPAYYEPLESGPHAHHADRAYQFFTNFVMTDNDSNYREFDIMRPGRYKARLIEISEMIDATDPDLSRFAARGGKIILLHGTEDASLSPLGVQMLYENIVATVGSELANNFIRFYMVPGLAHGGGNMSPAWDNLSALERWVEDGIPPTGQIVTDTTDSPTRGRTRPLCAYPTWPKYIGEGDLNSATSFRCVTD